MAQINSPSRFKVEDFSPDDRPLVSKLFFILNNFMEQVVSALTNNLTFSDNFRAIDTEIIVQTPLSNVSVRNTLNKPIRGAMVLRVDNLTNPNGNLSGAPFVEFVNGVGQIKINNITGLTTATKYRLRVVFFP